MDHSERGDTALVRAARLGDTDAFAAIVLRHGPGMRRYARSVLGSDEDAADATQDALVSAWQGLDSFRGEAALRTWLITLVHRRATDISRRRRPTPFDDAVLEVHLESTGSSGDVTIDGALESGLLAALREALLELPWLQRSCWLLREVEGLSYDEIAATLSITPTSARGHLHRGRQALRTSMEAWR